MEIEIWTCSRTYSRYGAAFAVMLRCGKHQWVRSIKCGKLTTNQTELKAVEYALKSIRKEFEDHTVKVRTSWRYVDLMMSRHSDGTFKKRPVGNMKSVNEVRNQFARFKDITIEIAEDDKAFKQLGQFCEYAAKKNQLVFDCIGR